MCESSSLSVHGVALDVSRWRDPTVEEVAAMLLEAAPHLVPSRADAISGEARGSRETSRGSRAPHTPPQSLAGSFAGRARGRTDASSRCARLKARLDACVAADVTQPLDWSELVHVVRSEELASGEFCAVGDDDVFDDPLHGVRAVDVNSGGAVFFCVFSSPAKKEDERRVQRVHRVAVIKFCADRLACVSEHFAGELAGALGVATPTCRLARRDDKFSPRRFSTNDDANDGTPSNEWFAALDAARRLLARSMLSSEVQSHDHAVDEDDASVAFRSAESLAACLEKHECALVQRFVVGAPFLSPRSARLVSLQNPPLARSARGNLAEALGRVFVLDCLLANADRMPCAELGWRGNRGNLLLANTKEGGFALCAIDQSVARRVPRRRAAEDAAAVPRVLELVRNRPSVARDVLLELCGGLEGLEDAFGFVVSEQKEKASEDGGEKASRTAERAPAETSPSSDPDPDPDDDALWPADVRFVTRRFVLGTVAAVDACGSLAGVFAATAEALRSTLAALFEDLDARGSAQSASSPSASPETSPSRRSGSKSSGEKNRAGAGAATDTSAASHSSPPTLPIAERGTMRLRSVQRDARASSEVDEWLRSWSTLARREKGKVRAMLRDWAARHFRRHVTPDDDVFPVKATSTSFSCAFLDVTETSRSRKAGRDVVDLYELWARVSRLSEKAVVMGETANTRRPPEIAPGLFLGGALEANAKHTLVSLGVTHVLNCAEDEIPGETHEGAFVYQGVRGVKDVSSRENAETFRAAFDAISAFVFSAREGVLVHCFEGKSRSATAAAQHLIRVTPGATATQVMARIAARKKDARPNAWFAKALETFADERRVVKNKRFSSSPAKDPTDASSGGSFCFATRQEKPRARRCPKCGAPCGVSALAVQAHVRREHKDMYA